MEYGSLLYGMGGEMYFDGLSGLMRAFHLIALVFMMDVASTVH